MTKIFLQKFSSASSLAVVAGALLAFQNLRTLIVSFLKLGDMAFWSLTHEAPWEFGPTPPSRRPGQVPRGKFWNTGGGPIVCPLLQTIVAFQTGPDVALCGLDPSKMITVGMIDTITAFRGQAGSRPSKVHFYGSFMKLTPLCPAIALCPLLTKQEFKDRNMRVQGTPVAGPDTRRPSTMNGWPLVRTLGRMNGWQGVSFFTYLPMAMSLTRNDGRRPVRYKHLGRQKQYYMRDVPHHARYSMARYVEETEPYIYKIRFETFIEKRLRIRQHDVDRLRLKLF